jgi:ubiquinone/menaquinone biosynthesis C-methylase UbiE
MADYYPRGYHDNRDTAGHMLRYKIQAEFLPPLQDENVLDIGCARGDWLIYLKGLYPRIKASGVDSYADSAKSGEVHFICSNLPACGFHDSQFDIITSWAVFEHLHRPSEYFREVARILKAKGAFVMLVTNSESLYGTRAFVEDVPRHLFHFSETTLQKYAEKYGLAMTSCSYDDRVFDGRGMGTVYYWFLFKAGITWQHIYFSQFSKTQRLAGKIGAALDRIVFKKHWEAERKKSGIMIAKFTKP